MRRTLLAMILASTGLPLLTVAANAAPAPEVRTVHLFLDVALAPDGRHVASVEGDAPLSGGYPPVRDLLIRDTADSKAVSVPLPCAGARECWPSSLAWSKDGKTLAFALRKPGSHDRSLYTVSAAGGTPKLLLSFNGTIEDLRFGPHDELALLAVAGAVKEVGATQAGAPVTGDLGGPPPEQRIAILKDGALHWASPAGMWVYQYDWLPDGSGFAGTAAEGDGDAHWWSAKLYRFAAADGSGEVIFTPPTPRNQIADPHVSPDGKHVAFISGIMSDFGSTGGDIWSVPLSGGHGEDMTPQLAASARSIGYDCKGTLRALLLKGSETQLVSVTPAPGRAQLRVLWHGEDSIRGGLNNACPSGTSAIVHENFTTPPELATGPAGHWRDLTHANASLSAPLTARSIEWRNGGYQAQGWLLLPQHRHGKLPLITDVHGGPAAANVPHFIGEGTMRSLLEAGYAIFLPNPRGSFGQGEAFTLANVRDLGHGDLADILAGIDAAEKAAPIDDARLGIMGGSYGGFMTMWAVTQTHRFKAGVAAAGISDWTSYYGENGIDDWLIPYFGASVYDDPQVYERSSPIRFIKNVKTPVFAYVGADDIECPAPQTQEFWHALHELGVPTSYAIYPGEGHGLRDPKHIADAERRTMEWFATYLK